MLGEEEQKRPCECGRGDNHITKDPQSAWGRSQLGYFTTLCAKESLFAQWLNRGVSGAALPLNLVRFGSCGPEVSLPHRTLSQLSVKDFQLEPLPILVEVQGVKLSQALFLRDLFFSLSSTSFCMNLVLRQTSYCYRTSFVSMAWEVSVLKALKVWICVGRGGLWPSGHMLSPEQSIVTQNRSLLLGHTSS